ncbi:MAG: hypothetical protein PUE01_10490 [Clostridiaceae bacterium]|nr:hypothetical protein [Clostridiaceae bacterium]
MFKLIYSELIKLISKKKNILILAAMLILIGSYVKNMLPKDTDVVADTVSKYNAAVKEIQTNYAIEKYEYIKEYCIFISWHIL